MNYLDKPNSEYSGIIIIDQSQFQFASNFVGRGGRGGRWELWWHESTWCNQRNRQVANIAHSRETIRRYLVPRPRFDFDTIQSGVRAVYTPRRRPDNHHTFFRRDHRPLWKWRSERAHWRRRNIIWLREVLSNCKRKRSTLTEFVRLIRSKVSKYALPLLGESLAMLSNTWSDCHSSSSDWLLLRLEILLSRESATPLPRPTKTSFDDLAASSALSSKSLSNLYETLLHYSYSDEWIVS